MKKVAEYAETPKISIGGMEFEQKMSDGDVYAVGRATVAACLRLDTMDERAVLDMLHILCAFVDDALGEGAVKKIVGDKPVTLPMALKILNTIIETCGGRYAAYIQREYTGGKV